MTINDIEGAKSEAIAILDEKIADAVSLRNSGSAKMEPIIARLMEQRTSMMVQAFSASLDVPTMMQALKAIKAATADMRIAAKNLISAQQFIANVSRLETAANGVLGALATSLPGEGGSRPIKPPT